MKGLKKLVPDSFLEVIVIGAIGIIILYPLTNSRIEKSFKEYQENSTATNSYDVDNKRQEGFRRAFQHQHEIQSLNEKNKTNSFPNTNSHYFMP